MAKSRKVVPDSGGFDIVVWQRSAQSPTWVCGYTRAGTSYLKTYNLDYVQGKAMKLENVYPKEFADSIPYGVRVGATLNIRTPPTELHILPLH